MSNFKYKPHDEFLIFNEDKDLSSIHVELPSPPKDKKLIANYGLTEKKQKFYIPFIPKKLFNLNKDKSVSLFEKADLMRENHEEWEDEIKFIEEEIDKRINGTWYYIEGKPTYIPGVYYFYLTAWKLERGYPDYRDRDRKFFIFSEFCENDKDCFGFIYPKHRREGATTKVACWNYEYISRRRRVRGGIQSKTEKDAELVFTKHIIPAWRKIAFWHKPVFEGTTNPKSALNFIAPALKITRTNMGVDEMDSLESSIDFLSSTEGAYDGSRLERYHADEVGKVVGVNVYKRHLVARQCLSELNKVIGKAIYTSTAGEMTKGGGAAFKQLIEASDFDSRDDNGRTTSGLYVLFMPATEGYIIDEFGNSVIEDPIEETFDVDGIEIKRGAKTFLLNERKKALQDEDFDKLNELTRQYPMYLRDCFRNASSTDNFNMKIIQSQIDKYQFGNDDVTIGDFIWRDGVKDSEVVFEPRTNGRFSVSWLFDNQKESNAYTVEDGVKIPSNTKKFIGGADVFKFKLTQGGKKSSGGGAIFMKRNSITDPNSKPIEEWETHKFVCTYLHRPKSKDEYCEDMLMMSVYYGCRMTPEINVPAVMDHFQRRGYDSYLHYVLDKSTGRYKKNPGYSTTSEIRETIFRAFQQLVEKHGHRIVHKDLLDQLLEINEDMGDFDLFAAGGMALIANEDEQSFIIEEEEEKDNGMDDYFNPRYY